MPEHLPTFEEHLHPHPAHRVAVGTRVWASGTWRSEQSLELCFTAQVPDITAIRVPPPQPPGPADGLWQHTCFELFIAALGDERYAEYNFSPSGQWARYRFAAERERDAEAERQAGLVSIPIQTTTQPNQLIVRAVLPLADLPSSPAGWLLGLTAVLEHSDGRLSHWALHHPRPQPDFHHPAGRVLRLAPPALS